MSFFSRLSELRGVFVVLHGIILSMDKNERERNEHFQGFARLLWSELQTALHDLIREPEDIIAQRAYDLAVHIIENLSLHDFEPYTYEVAKAEITEDEDNPISHIPDLTEWPTTEPSGPPTSEPR